MTTTIRPLSWAILAAFMGLLSVVLLAENRAHAAVYTVTTTADSADGVCDGHCSLREAVMAANANITTIDTISIPAGTFALSLNAAENALNPAAMRDLDLLNNNTTINGTGAGSTVIDGGYIDRIFEIHLNKVVTINNLTLQHGAPAGQGGALTAAGGSTVTLNGIVVAENQANDGGGIWNGGSMTVAAVPSATTSPTTAGASSTAATRASPSMGSRFHGNQAGGAGGGALYNDNNAALLNVTISDNHRNQQRRWRRRHPELHHDQPHPAQRHPQQQLELLRRQGRRHPQLRRAQPPEQHYRRQQRRWRQLQSRRPL